MRTRSTVVAEMWRLAVLAGCAYLAAGKIDSEDIVDSGDRDEDAASDERLGASVTQVFNHPYAASLLKHDTFECSAVVLNTYWLLTLSKCFDTDIVSTYVSHNKNLKNYTIRAGSTYNKKGGSLYQLKILINNFDLKVSAVKLEAPLVFGSRVQAVALPKPDEEVVLGHLASIVAWTPDGHMRLVNVPVIEASICEDNTKLLPGHYICVGGVQDPSRNFCRKDNAGPVIQNNTLVALATFVQTCAIYTRPHAFPKVSAFAHWLDSVIWDEHNRPTTTSSTTEHIDTAATETESPPFMFMDPSRFMLTLPYDPVNLPLEPDENNAIMPRVSLYESYLQNLAHDATSTTEDPNIKEQEKLDQARLAWLKKYGKSMLMNYKNMEYDYNDRDRERMH